jgi:hypothetical protein
MWSSLHLLPLVRLAQEDRRARSCLIIDRNGPYQTIFVAPKFGNDECTQKRNDSIKWMTDLEPMLLSPKDVDEKKRSCDLLSPKGYRLII